MNKLLKRALTNKESRDMSKIKALATATPNVGDPWAPAPSA
jgi:hypothetical protein